MLVKMYPVSADEQPTFETTLGKFKMFSIYHEMSEIGSVPVEFDSHDFIEFQNVCEDNFPFLDYVSGNLSFGDTPFSKNVGESFEETFGEENAPIAIARHFNKKGLMCRESFEVHETPEYAWLIL